MRPCEGCCTRDPINSSFAEFLQDETTTPISAAATVAARICFVEFSGSPTCRATGPCERRVFRRDLFQI